jgi:hypothetical protein
MSRAGGDKGSLSRGEVWAAQFIDTPSKHAGQAGHERCTTQLLPGRLHPWMTNLLFHAGGTARMVHTDMDHDRHERGPKQVHHRAKTAVSPVRQQVQSRLLAPGSASSLQEGPPSRPADLEGKCWRRPPSRNARRRSHDADDRDALCGLATRPV